MKTHSYAFLIEAPKGAPLEAVDGFIVKLFPRKAGTSAGGKDWSFQNGEMQLLTGETIKLKFSFCEEINQSWRGKKVRLASTVSQKGGRTGLYADDEEYNGTTTRLIRATGTHQLLDLADAALGVADEPTSPATPTAPSPATTAKPSQPAAAPHDFLSAVKQRIAKIAALQSISYDAAAQNAHRIYAHHGIAIMPGAVGVMGDRIFAEIMRRVDVDSMPIEPYRTAPFKGHPLSELIPHMRQQIAEGKAEIDFEASEARMALGAKAAGTLPPAEIPQEQDGHDDTIPF